MLTVTLLGTGSPLPDADRAGPATLVQGSGEQFLIDAGRGVLMRLAAAGASAASLTAVLLTHLHSDHFTDLGDVITSRWVLSFEPSPLAIVGPVGTKAVVDHLLASLGPDIGYRIAHHGDLPYPPPVQVIEVTGGAIDLDSAVRLHCAPTDHRPVDASIGYRLDHEGASVVLSSHLLDLVEELCTKLLVIAKGQAVAYGTLEQIVSERPELQGRTLEEVFLLLTGDRDAHATAG